MHFTVHIVHTVCSSLMSFINSPSNNICCAEKLYSQEEKPKNTEEKSIGSFAKDTFLLRFLTVFLALIYRVIHWYFACSDALKRENHVKKNLYSFSSIDSRNSCRVRNKIYLWELFVIHAVHELLLKKTINIHWTSLGALSKIWLHL